jgi:hypothetical protein
MPTRQKRHWARVENRHRAEAQQVQRDMDLDPDTVQGQSTVLPPCHPCHYEMVAPPPSGSGTGTGGSSSACTIQ